MNPAERARIGTLVTLLILAVTPSLTQAQSGPGQPIKVTYGNKTVTISGNAGSAGGGRSGSVGDSGIGASDSPSGGDSGGIADNVTSLYVTLFVVAGIVVLLGGIVVLAFKWSRSSARSRKRQDEDQVRRTVNELRRIVVNRGERND